MSKAVVARDHVSIEDIREFLRLNKLPYQDVTIEGNIFLGYFDENGKMIGSGGLELFDDLALLRSIAVDEASRGKSYGKRIVDDLVAKAKTLEVKRIYLLTETAHDFFIKKGFTDTTREIVPEAVKSSSEFTYACPASAVCMVLELK